MRFDRRGPLALAASALAEDFATIGVVPNDSGVLRICGPLLHHWSPLWDSYDAIRARAAEVFEGPAPALVLHIDSPGGEVSGCFELARALRRESERSGKPILAFVDGAACSAAYALAAASTVVMVPETGRVGSIGVINVLADETAANRARGLRFEVVTSGARKSDGSPLVPISEDAIGALQHEVDSLAERFFALVSDMRPKLSVEAVRGLDAATFVGAEAVARGLADRVGTLEDALTWARNPASAFAARAEEKDNTVDEKELKAALAKMAESDDEKVSARAKAALKALAEDEKPEDKAEDEKPVDDGADAEDEDKDKKPDAEDEKPEDKAEDEKQPDAKASAKAMRSIVRAELAERDARAEMLASRPDVAKNAKLVAELAALPLKTARALLTSIPIATPAAKVSAAAITPTATRGEGQGGDARADRLPPDEAAQLDAMMGLQKPANAIESKGNVQIFRPLTPEQARARLAQKDGAK